MVKVRCVMMQRNERALLEPWLRYHAYLFGLSNLVVLDNGSTDEHVLSVLARYQRSGCEVIRRYSSPSDFARKGAILADIIRRLDSLVDYDIAIPSDCDEFLCYLEGNRLRCDRDGIIAQLSRLAGKTCPLQVGATLFNVPAQPGWFSVTWTPKSLVCKDTVVMLDPGSHIAWTVSGEEPEVTPLVHVHLHHRRFAEMRAFAAQKLAAVGVDAADEEALRQYQGDGVHLTRFLLMSEHEYGRLHTDAPVVAFPEFVAQLRMLGISLDDTLLGTPEPLREPVACIAVRLPAEGGTPGRILDFAPAHYLEANGDLRQGGQNPLVHFVLWGWKEGRPYAPPPPSAALPQVRRAVQADLPAIVAMLADDELGSTREAPDAATDDRYAAAFAAIDADPNQALVVLDDAGSVVGCLQLTFIPGLSLHGAWRGQIEAVRVVTSRRGEGLGRIMLNWAIAESRRRGCTLVQLTTNKVRIDALRFYRSLGFVDSHEGLKLYMSG